MKQAVIDASVAVKWVLDEPGSQQARGLAGARLEAPDLLLVECANILWKKAQLGDLRPAEALARLDLLGRAPVAWASSPDLLGDALRLALDLRHPVYDCLYLALALQLGIPLVTADRRFARAVSRRPALARRLRLLDDLPASG